MNRIEISDTQVEHWASLLEKISDKDVFTAVVNWAANTELEYCVDWVSFHVSAQKARALRNTRVFNLPSIKKRALDILNEADSAEYPHNITILTSEQHAIIRQALEQLND